MDCYRSVMARDRTQHSCWCVWWSRQKKGTRAVRDHLPLLPFLVMEYAPGGTLRKRHPKGERLPLPTFVAYVQQVAEALQYAHDQRLIHRDVKPDNLLLGRQGEILLSDFGIALLAHSSRSQRTEDIVGTVSYMAPEQIQGHPCQASDQYALGVIAYEWLSGIRPFCGSVVEVPAQDCL